VYALTRLGALACAFGAFGAALAAPGPAVAEECYGPRVAGVCATSWCVEGACSVTLPGAYAFCEHPLPTGWCAAIAVPPSP